MRICLDLYGNHLQLSSFEKKIIEDVYIDEEGDHPIDCLSIQNPMRIGVEYELEDYEKWYVEFLEKYYDEMIEAGIEEINLVIDVFYSEQCNFEIFGRDLMMRLGKYPIAFPVSVYQTSDAELEAIKSLQVKPS